MLIWCGQYSTIITTHQSAVFGFHPNCFGLNLGYVDLVWTVRRTKSLVINISIVWIQFELFWVEFGVCWFGVCWFGVNSTPHKIIGHQYQHCLDSIWTGLGWTWGMLIWCVVTCKEIQFHHQQLHVQIWICLLFDFSPISVPCVGWSFCSNAQGLLERSVAKHGCETKWMLSLLPFYDRQYFSILTVWLGSETWYTIITYVWHIPTVS